MNKPTTNISIIGVPIDLGAASLGVEVGPDAFRQKNIISKLKGVGFEIQDLGNIEIKPRSELSPGDPKTPYLDEIVRVNQKLAIETEQQLKSGRKVVVLGGDHSINLGAFSGAKTVFKQDLGLIYVDAHFDANTPENSISHNIHGMHLASLMGFGPDKLTRLHGPETKLPPANLLHIAGSDNDRGEIELFKKENVDAFTMIDLLSYGLAPLFKKIDELCQRLTNVWVSVDLDAIDFVYAPGVGIPNRGGLSYREIAAITDYIGQKPNIVGIDLVEYNPMHDIEGKTAELGIELVAKVLGSNYSWYTNYMDNNSHGSYNEKNKT